MRHALGGNPDRIDQTARPLDHARQWVAGAQFAGHRFGHEGAKAIEVDYLVKPFRKSARRRHHRIAQFEPADIDGETDGNRLDHGSASNRSNTGPSQQTLRLTISPPTLKSRTQQ